MLSPDFWWALYSFLRTGYYLSACANLWGTVCPRVQIDGVLFVRLCKSTGYYLSACAKMTGYYLSGVLFVRDSVLCCQYVKIISNLKIKLFSVCLLHYSFCNHLCVFNLPEHKVLKVSFCYGPLSVVRRPQSVHLCVRASTVSLNNFSSETTHWILTKLHRKGPWVVLYQNCSNMFQLVAYVGHGVKKQVFKMQFSKIFLSETTRPRAFILGIQHHLEVLYQSCSNCAPGVKIDPAPGVTILH